MNELKHLIVKEEEDGVVVLVLKNPPVNALSTGLLADLEGVVGSLAQDRSKRAVILTGDGSYFSAGADLKEMAGMVGEFRTEAPKVVARGHRPSGPWRSSPSRSSRPSTALRWEEDWSWPSPATCAWPGTPRSWGPPRSISA
jgi:hypothetical protein